MKMLRRTPDFDSRNRFRERELDRLGLGRPREERLVPFEMRRGLAVGHHDDLPRCARVLGEEAAGQHEGMLHVGAVRPLEAGRREVLGLQLPGVVAEADQVERVVGVAALDQRVQRQRQLLGVDEVAAQRHRERQVEQ